VRTTVLPRERRRWVPRWVRRGLRGWRGPVAAVLAVVTVVAVVLGALGRLPGQDGTAAAAGSGSATGSGSASGSAASRPVTAGPVLTPDPGTAPVPTTSGLSAALGSLLADPDLGSRVGAVVVDLTTGQQLYRRSASSGFVPASTTKLLTAAAALKELGPAYRMQTTVVTGAAGQVVLVGGGDPTLATAPPAGFVPAPASLPALAAQVAAALKAKGTTRIRLGYDASVFTGPSTAPSWSPAYVSSGVVSPVVGLMVDEGRVGLIAEGTAPRVPDPSLGAARAFARQLARQGVTVVGNPVPAAAPAGATTLGTVESPQLSDLLGWMLSTSDNDLAEALLRQVARHAGQPADFPGGVDAAMAVLAAAGIPVDNVRMYDGSGLSRSTQVPPEVMGRILALAASADGAYLRSLLTGMAVAGFTGSLEPPRFDSVDTRAAAGMVRGKTGTLTGVSALVGTVDDADGRVLGFVFLADHVPDGGTLDARNVLEDLATVVARCGCR
jgi:D-alanyl-D-alanine carboxypeptidase/D-alanyl-D-alanine-endopeptidase (penicillin-binding protein 4)